MIAGRHSEDYYPITWVGRFPIYITTLLVIIHVTTMVGTVVATSITGIPDPIANPWLQPLVYTSAGVLQHLSLWQFGSYAFINLPSVWFAIEMVLLYSFGREIEKFLGRKSFLLLYVSLLLVGPAVLTLLGLAHIHSAPLYGSGAIHFAVFVAFVTLYPNVEMMFFRIQIKWIAVILLAVYSLGYIAFRDWTDLGIIWLESACAVLMMRRAGVMTAQFESWIPAERNDDPPRLRGRARREELPEPDLHESIDPLLEKISRHGIGSLTKRERQRLEQARADLLQREKQR
ncbi:MAG: rhomboid family intramembrane serine protease [Chthoniobacterales bacterium]